MRSQSHSEYFKNHFLDLLQVAFLVAQKAENEFAWPIDNLKHRFIDYTQVANWADHKTENKISNSPKLHIVWARE
jgi:hypothetical protein